MGKRAELIGNHPEIWPSTDWAANWQTKRESVGSGFYWAQVLVFKQFGSE